MEHYNITVKKNLQLLERMVKTVPIAITSWFNLLNTKIKQVPSAKTCFICWNRFYLLEEVPFARTSSVCYNRFHLMEQVPSAKQVVQETDVSFLPVPFMDIEKTVGMKKRLFYLHFSDYGCTAILKTWVFTFPCLGIQGFLILSITGLFQMSVVLVTGVFSRSGVYYTLPSTSQSANVVVSHALCGNGSYRYSCIRFQAMFFVSINPK
jgi:hypothetical protein